MLSYLDFGTWTLKKARLPDLVSFSVVNLNSLKAISFKGRFPGCMRIAFYARQLDILEIIFWFSFIVMFLCENNVNLSEAKNDFYSQPFLKMRKLLLDMRKDFLIMSNFYLVEILSEPSSLTIVTSKKILKMSNYVFVLSIFFLIMRIRNLQCTVWTITGSRVSLSIDFAAGWNSRDLTSYRYWSCWKIIFSSTSGSHTSLFT